MDSLILQQNDSNPSRKVTFLDGGCSLATETLAALSGKFYLIPMVHGRGASGHGLVGGATDPLSGRYSTIGEVGCSGCGLVGGATVVEGST